jgi:Holliday junction resolvasome RuvABC endonuclease subunit
MTKINRTVLAIDPGISHFGYAILRGARLAAAGVHTVRATSEVSRQTEIRSITRDWIKDFRPSVVVLEATYHHRLHVFKTLHRTARTIDAVARLYRIPVYSVSVRSVRRTLAGNGNATKRELAQAITILFPSLRVYLRQNRRWKDRYFSNLFDAVALAVFYKVRHPFTS